MDDNKLAEKAGAQRLADAERIIVLGNDCIARQRALIQKLREKGGDTTFEEQLLAIFVRSQVLHERRCVRLRMELASALHEEIFSCRKV
jgi:aryl carrier-like protein